MLKLNDNILEVTLPEGKTQEELIQILGAELRNLEDKLHGLSLQINGRITTGMSLFLGHKLSHICKDVSIYDPKDRIYVKAIWH